VIKLYLVKMMIDSKFFIICFLAIIAFCESEELFEIKSNDTLKGQTKQLFSDYFETCDWNNNCSGDHQVCVDHICRCAPNYKHNTDTYQCENFKCTLDSDCWDYDYNRYCSYGTCYCSGGHYVDYSNGEKCTYFYDYTWVWILVGIIILLKVFIIICCIRIRRNRYLAALRASQQPIIIVRNTGYGSIPDQSNQFPAGYPQNFNNPPPPPYSIR